MFPSSVPTTYTDGSCGLKSKHMPDPRRLMNASVLVVDCVEPVSWLTACVSRVTHPTVSVERARRPLRGGERCPKMLELSLKG
jgi:hypothetical protein